MSATAPATRTDAPAPVSGHDDRHDDRPGTRWATRLGFLVAGFGMACWAPLVPVLQQRLGLSAGALGLLMLCMGLGSVASMVAAGWWSARHGPRPVILSSGLSLALCVPLLAAVQQPWQLGLALAAFGASVGALDVAINVHAAAVERAAGRPLMAGFHAQFSLGGFLGAGLMTWFLAVFLPGLGALASALPAAALMALAMLLAWQHLLQTPGTTQPVPLLAWPRGPVRLLAALAGLCFLVEGAVLDWGGLFILQQGLASPAQAGLGYVLFSLAMTAGRLAGDAASTRLGDRRLLQAGGLLAAAGFGLLLLAPWAPLALAGFAAIGLGAANLVPVLFRRTGVQTQMPVPLAIAAVSTTGYAGVLLGPAAVGAVAQFTSLGAAFWGLGLLLLPLVLLGRRVAP
ncbi:MFS transporter [Ideonella livida]|uniref:MFS transporter n=1 Tax=Ideonella livida TaxID=2707176 RepID=A0A7C9PF47_9BURK|nr:MFS transporter [Ideonella livida]NDY90255.1 MFS transporter [Ideonella livida]